MPVLIDKVQRNDWYGDKLPCAADSNRHNESLKLATDLLLMLDGDKASVQRIVEAQPWVKEIIDERGENVGQTVASAAECVAQKEKKYASSLPSKAMLEAVQKATGKTYQEITKAQTHRAVMVAGVECLSVGRDLTHIVFKGVFIDGFGLEL